MTTHVSEKARQIFFEPYHYIQDDGVKERKSDVISVSIEEFFGDYFGRRVIITPNGRMAISIIMKSLNLKLDDEVYITTTFQKPNVSSCVTSTIFNFCKPSRILSDKTKAIFIIHEFGVPHPDTEKLALLAKEQNIILIEDCAHTIDSKYNGRKVGSYGDYAIYSLPKIFPVKYGGFLVGGDLDYLPTEVQRGAIEEVRRLLPKYMRCINEYSGKKRTNFRSLKERFKKIFLGPLHDVNDEITPSFFFPLVTDRFEAVIEEARRAGIECALWHGTNMVVLPIHQFLNEVDLEYIFKTVSRVYKNGNHLKTKGIFHGRDRY